MKIKQLVIFLTLFTIFISCSNNNENENSIDSLLLPEDYSIDSAFWDNASVYFVLTDRFYNGNLNNDTSYGREKGSPSVAADAGKFFGGDIKGLTEKLDYLDELGINAIWISCPYEQIHGWCVGGYNEFKHYPYHGYYALDYTNIDANIGTVDEFKTFVDTAHSKGIRVIMDVVMNHPGYNTIEDASHLYPSVLKSGYQNASLTTYHNYIDYKSHGWDAWWNSTWIRAGLCSHYSEGSGDLTGSCGGSLPDFRTESDFSVELPAFLQLKHSEEMSEYYPTEGYEVVKFEEKAGYTARDYIIYWLSSWVRKFGIDGFRCDTAKHVEKEAWYQLKVACVQALRDWKSENPTKVISDSGDFWMTGEHFGHIVAKDSYYTDGGFNSMINFDFRKKAAEALAAIPSIDSVYSSYANAINSDSSFNVLSYISSHDTGSQDQKGLFYGSYATDATSQKVAGSLLAMCPGAIQLYYGDEAGRTDSVLNITGDKDQKNRSQMPWGEDIDNDIKNHWSKVLNFRKKHVAIGSGSHNKLSVSNGYAFSRIKDSDKVIVVLDANKGTLEIDVSSLGFDNVRDAYSNGTSIPVVNGKATFEVGTEGILLIEKAE